jgi:hypothetical protein
MDEDMHARRMQRPPNVAQDRLAALQEFRYIDRLRRPDVLLQYGDELVLGEQLRPSLPFWEIRHLIQIRDRWVITRVLPPLLAAALRAAETR